MNPTIDILRGELERLFTLEELQSMSDKLLGLAPASDSTDATKASVSRTIAERCVDSERVDALVDVMLFSKKSLDPRLFDTLAKQSRSAPEPGKTIGAFTIERVTGESDVAFIVAVTRDNKPLTALFLKRAVLGDRRAVQRFLTANRLVAQVAAEGLPTGLEAGEVDGEAYVSYTRPDGESLASRMARSGPMHFGEASKLMRGILEPLAALHEAGLVHGDLRCENILVDKAGRITLTDFGNDKLRRSRDESAASKVQGTAGIGGPLAVWGSPRTVAPEVVRGLRIDASTDIYAFAAVAYELLTGKPVFSFTSNADAAFAHLTQQPEAPSTKAPTGWVTKDVDIFLLPLLGKEPSSRPRDARTVLAQLDRIGKGTTQKLEPEAFAELVSKLETAPDDHDVALTIEHAVQNGADIDIAANAFLSAADAVIKALEGETDSAKANTQDARDLRKALLFRAARTFAADPAHKAKAEHVYSAIIETDSTDEVAFRALVDLRKALHKYEELVEMLLERSQSASSSAARAEALGEIGHVYAHELDDGEQATVAYAQALGLQPRNEAYIAEIERLCGRNAAPWNETLGTLTEALKADDVSASDRQALLLHCARWYDARLGRADLALLAYQQVLGQEPSNEEASDGLVAIYRRAEQWPELLQVLLAKADASATTPRARDLRVEAAELLELRLNDPSKAREVYKQILADDPGHVKAGDALARIHEKAADFAALVAVLDKRAEARRGAEKVEAIVRAAETYEDHLGDLNEATRRYESALAIDPKNLGALKGLDRIYNRTGKYRELLETLERQIQAAATPRQKVNLYERVAALHDEEFLDHAAAANALDAILLIDPAHDGSLTGLVRHYRALHRFDAVVAVLEKHASATSDDNRKIDLLMARGRVLSEHIGSPERAIRTYEDVLKQQPGHAGALEAVAHLREASGDAQAALSAIEMLAAKAATTELKAEHWMRAGRLLEARGDKDGAIERFKLALEANPRDGVASNALRKAYTERGDAGSVVGLIEQELKVADTDLQKSRLYAEMARAQKDKLRDSGAAELSAKKAGELDPNSADAALVMGDLAFESNRYAEAQRYYEALIGRIQVLPKQDGTRVLTRYIEAFGKATPRSTAPSMTDMTSMPPPAQTHPKLMAAVEALQLHATTDVRALADAASVLFDHGEPKLVYKVYDELFKKHDASLVGAERAEALFQLGESARRSGELELAVGPLRESAKVDPSDPRPYKALGRIYEATGDWEEMRRMLEKRLPLVTAAERFDLLLEIGDVEFQRLSDRARAQQTYAKALEERPDDRKLLTKLMQLYSEEKDWAKVVEVVTRLADFVDEKTLRAKYMHTAATIMGKQLGLVDKALEFYSKVLDLDPSLTKAREEAIELYKKKNAYNDVERLLHAQLDAAKEAGDRERMPRLLDELGDVYHQHLKQPEMAIDAYEAAQAFEPEGRERAETLAELYASDPAQYLDKAVRAQAQMLRYNPYRVESYKLLRKLYTEARHADPAWCLSQALSVLNLAGPDEEKFYQKHRAPNAAPAQAVTVDEDWARIAHPELDPILTKLFATIQPIIARARTQPLEAQGYDPRHAIDPSVHPYAMSQTLYYAIGVFGMHGLRVFQNADDPCGLGFVHAPEPAILLGRAGLEAQISTQMLAFVAARHISYFRPGLYVRQLVPTTSGLKAWLFGAIKLCVPNFPIAPDMQGPVAEALGFLQQALHGPQRDVLASTVAKLLQAGGAIDLKRWVSAIDLTADRAGLVLAHDLEVTTELIRAGESEGSVSVKDRMKEIVLFSVSEDYFALRKKLSIAIDS